VLDGILQRYLTTQRGACAADRPFRVGSDQSWWSEAASEPGADFLTALNADGGEVYMRHGRALFRDYVRGGPLTDRSSISVQTPAPRSARLLDDGTVSVDMARRTGAVAERFFSHRRLERPHRPRRAVGRLAVNGRDYG